MYEALQKEELKDKFMLPPPRRKVEIHVSLFHMHFPRVLKTPLLWRGGCRDCRTRAGAVSACSLACLREELPGCAHPGRTAAHTPDSTAPRPGSNPTQKLPTRKTRCSPSLSMRTTGNMAAWVRRGLGPSLWVTQGASSCCCGTNGHGFRHLQPRERTFLQFWRPQGQSRCHWAPGKMSLGLDQGRTRSSPSLPREPAALLGSWLHRSAPASVVTRSSPLVITFWARLRHPDSLSPNDVFAVPFFYVR